MLISLIVTLSTENYNKWKKWHIAWVNIKTVNHGILMRNIALLEFSKFYSFYMKNKAFKMCWTDLFKVKGYKTADSLKSVLFLQRHLYWHL